MNDLRSINGIEYEIKRAIIHPKFDGNANYDISLLELTQKVTN